LSFREVWGNCGKPLHSLFFKQIQEIMSHSAKQIGCWMCQICICKCSMNIFVVDLRFSRQVVYMSNCWGTLFLEGTLSQSILTIEFMKEVVRIGMLPQWGRKKVVRRGGWILDNILRQLPRSQFREPRTPLRRQCLARSVFTFFNCVFNHVLSSDIFWFIFFFSLFLFSSFARNLLPFHCQLSLLSSAC